MGAAACCRRGASTKRGSNTAWLQHGRERRRCRGAALKRHRLSELPSYDFLSFFPPCFRPVLLWRRLVPNESPFFPCNKFRIRQPRKRGL